MHKTIVQKYSARGALQTADWSKNGRLKSELAVFTIRNRSTGRWLHYFDPLEESKTTEKELNPR